MRRKQESDVPVGAAVQTAYYDVELLRKFSMRIITDGFVPAEELKVEFGNDAYTMAIAVLFRQFRLIGRHRRPWGDGEADGYEWSDERHSKSHAKSIPEDLQFLLKFSKAKQNRYTDFALITAHCRWTNFVLGAVPGKDATGAINVFERDADEAITIPAYCLRAMTYRSLALLGKEPSIAPHIRYSGIRVSDPKVVVKEHAVVKGTQGLGIKRSESLEPGTTFTIEAWVPTSALSQADYVSMLRLAGKYVRLSPARSAGYGDFIVESFE